MKKGDHCYSKHQMFEALEWLHQIRLPLMNEQLSVAVEGLYPGLHGFYYFWSIFPRLVPCGNHTGKPLNLEQILSNNLKLWETYMSTQRESRNE